MLKVRLRLALLVIPLHSCRAAAVDFLDFTINFEYQYLKDSLRVVLLKQATLFFIDKTLLDFFYKMFKEGFFYVKWLWVVFGDTTKVTKECLKGPWKTNFRSTKKFSLWFIVGWKAGWFWVERVIWAVCQLLVFDKMPSHKIFRASFVQPHLTDFFMCFIVTTALF